MFDYMRRTLYSPEQIRQQERAESARDGIIFGAHIVLFAGYALLAFVLLPVVFAIAAMLITLGLHILVANRAWKG